MINVIKILQKYNLNDLKNQSRIYYTATEPSYCQQ